VRVGGNTILALLGTERPDCGERGMRQGEEGDLTGTGEAAKVKETSWCSCTTSRKARALRPVGHVHPN